MITVADRISVFNPCSEAREWAAGYTSPPRAWRECQRGDWMLWLLGRLSGDPESPARRRLVACAADCAALALPVYEARCPGDRRVLDCIEACQRWSRGEITTGELRAAAYAAADSAYGGYAAYAANAAYAAYAAANAAAYAARTNTLAECADIVRSHYPKPPRIK